MAVCSFDMKFTFVYPGWEGSAHDGRVFMAAVSNLAYNFPHPPIHKYYVVDSVYTNMPGYLAPYRGQRYHPNEWNGVTTVFQCSSISNRYCMLCCPQLDLNGAGRDEFFDEFSEDEDEDANGEQGNVEQINMSAENLALMATRRNEIAQMMWENY
ncbi:uncharacterized protein LOC131299574 [Rhododendron vialii]|uniref:uncharacterized protein LOC131299574 n=1 Tax=Rhododendron vialii TaxID=182163 RepID=UPI00265E99CE|nr:uncharacterized protein LOC131299574 [Rhododendron vialii]